ncbi:MAG: lysophospholipid acyltransferase family protein [Blastocatellia bacterium]
MRTMRTIIRAAGFALIMAGCFLPWLAGALLLAPWARGARLWRCRMFRLWARLVTALLGINLETSGPAPRAPFFLVANHLSYLDIIVLAARLDCIFIAKSEVARWPVLGLLCHCMNTIFIDRRRKRDILRVNRLIEQALDRGENIVLFPEGTTTDGKTILPFKSALLDPVARRGFPVSLASLHYATEPGDGPASENICWWGDMDFLPHLLRLFAIPRFRARLRFGDNALRNHDRKQLARELGTAVADIFTPVAQTDLTDTRQLQPLDELVWRTKH